MTIERVRDAAGNDDPRKDRRFMEVFRRCLAKLQEDGFIDPKAIIEAEPEIGPAVVEDLETFVQLHSDDDSEDAPPLGTLGDYTLRRQIGRGGMGVVYEAWENSMDRVVALKVLPPGVAADNKAFTRFLREAKTAGQLRHENIVGVYSTGVKEGTPWYSMEYVEGQTLAEILARIKDAEPDTETPFGPKDQVDYFARLGRAFADVADGLQHAHSKGVIHRDIKPSNLILDGDCKLRILDFGLARLEGQETLTLSGDLMGTVLYMSPEQAMTKRIPLDHRTDVYSLGATMYEAICGRPPFRGKDHADTLSQIIERDPVELRKVNLRVPKDLETIVLKCLRKDAADRYGTAEALGQDLLRFVRGHPIEARPRGRGEVLAARCKRHRGKLLVGFAFLVLLVALAWLNHARDESEKRRIEAERDRQMAAYEPAVSEILKTVYRGQFSLKVVAGEAMSAFKFPRWATRLPLLPGELTAVREPVADPASVTQLEAVAEIVPQPDPHYHLAKAYRLLGRPDDARRAAIAALDVDPDFLPAKVLQWELSEEWPARYEQAMARASSANADAGGWQPLWLEAYESLRTGRWREAAAAYRALIAWGNDNHKPYIGCFLEAYLGRGDASLELGDYWSAIESFSAARFDSRGFEPILLLGKTYHLAGQAQKAGETFEELYHESKPSEKTEVIFYVAAVYDSLGDFKAALCWIDRLGDEVASKERLLAYFLLQLNRAEEAIAVGRTATGRDPGDPLAYLLLTRALLRGIGSVPQEDRARRLTELVDVASRAVALDPEGTEARRHLRTVQALSYRYVSQSRSGAMKTRVLPAAILTAAMAYADSPFVLSQDICDHFEDPALPGWEASLSLPPVLSWDEGDLVVRNSVGGIYGLIGYSEPSVGDISIRAVATIQNPGAQGELDLGYGEAGEFGYVVEFWATGRTVLRRWDGVVDTTLADQTLANFEASEPHVFQLDFRGEMIEARVWQPGAPMPLEPVVHSEDATYREGRAAIGAHFENPTEKTEVRFHFACISSAPREPENWSCDEFEDPELPGWEPVGSLPPLIEVVNGDLLLRNVDGGTYGLIGRVEQVTGDVSIRAIASFQEPVGTGELDLGYGEAGGFGYIVEFYSSGRIMIVRYDGVNRVELGEAQLTDFDSAESHVFQLDVSGDLIEARAWGPPGVPVPLETAVEVVDDTYRRGRLAIGGTFPSPGENTAIRMERVCWLTSPPGPPDTAFRRADCNGDGNADIADAVFSLGSLFLGDGDPGCDDACDSNDDGAVDIADAIATLGVLFLGQGPIPFPGMADCGVDPTNDDLGCMTYSQCPRT